MHLHHLRQLRALRAAGLVHVVRNLLRVVASDFIVSASSRILKAKASYPMVYLTETSVPKLTGPY